MPRRPEPRERPLTGTAPRRRPGQPNPALESDSAAAGSSPEGTVPIARGTAARRNRSLKLSEQPQTRPPGVRLRPVSGVFDSQDRTGAGRSGAGHPLTDRATNAALRAYDLQVKESFDRIVPLLKQLSALQHEDDFVERAQVLAKACLGYTLPLPILEQAWVSQLDMRTLFAWCVFETYEQTSASFFQDDPLAAKPGRKLNAFPVQFAFF